MDLQPEAVWVLVDGVGQPCLRWVRHGEPSRRLRAQTEKRQDEYGPYTWHAYRLVPA